MTDTIAQGGKPALFSVAPRFALQDMTQALAFYGCLGFQTTYNNGDFAIAER